MEKQVSVKGLFMIDVYSSFVSSQCFYLSLLEMGLSLVADARQQDFPVDDQPCASHRWLLFCNRL